VDVPLLIEVGAGHISRCHLAVGHGTQPDASRQTQGT
jgi:hypothetical protein